MFALLVMSSFPGSNMSKNIRQALNFSSDAEPAHSSWWRGSYPGQPPDLVRNEQDSGNTGMQDAYDRNVNMKRRIAREVKLTVVFKYYKVLGTYGRI